MGDSPGFAEDATDRFWIFNGEVEEENLGLWLGFYI